MKFNHTMTFVCIGAFGFLTSYYAMAREFHIAMAYSMALVGWVVVACHEYQERVFDRAIQALVKKYMTNPPPEE